MSGRPVIEVVADWAGLPDARRVGELTATPARGKEVFAFEYDGDWLAAGQAAALDPGLQLYGGPQYPPVGHEQFVSNTDDHLRNHGFLLEASGFRLAPAYDVNPDPDGEGLTLDISESDNAQDLELALQVADLFRLRAAKARAIVDEVVAAVRTWRGVADARGLGRASQQRMARAFRIAEA